MTKILVSDYDKTFYINDLDIKRNIAAVNNFRNNGNLFIIATGRSYADLKRKIEPYQIQYDYALLNHGATIIDKDDNVILNIPINNLNLNIKNDLCLKKSINYFCCSELESRVDFDYPNLTKIAVRYLPLANIKMIKETIENKYLNINAYLVSSNMLEIVSKEINKAKAIDYLRKKLQIDKKDIYTIGDSYTDIDMIKEYNGYAMNNSVEELKKYAKEEVDSVSKLIKKIL